jgi:hypothetical protein
MHSKREVYLCFNAISNEATHSCFNDDRSVNDTSVNHDTRSTQGQHVPSSRPRPRIYIFVVPQECAVAVYVTDVDVRLTRWFGV